MNGGLFAILFDRTRTALVVEMSRNFQPQILTMTNAAETSQYFPRTRDELRLSFDKTIEQACANGWTLGWRGRGPSLN